MAIVYGVSAFGEAPLVCEGSRVCGLLLTLLIGPKYEGNSGAIAIP